MCDIKERHSYVNINRSCVHLIQYGDGDNLFKSSIGSPTSSIDSEKADRGLRKRLVIFLPGNPGILGVYHDFLVLLYKHISSENHRNKSGESPDEEPTLIAISHNNFDLPGDEGDNIETSVHLTVREEDLDETDKLMAKSNQPNSMELQVLNKLIILKKLLKHNLEDCQIVFVGHSIGCYVILRLLEDGLIASTHSGSVLIHPALENLAITEKGAFFARVFKYKVDYLISFLAYVADKLIPKSFRISATERRVGLADGDEKQSRRVIEAFSRMICYNELVATIEMAKSEFDRIKDIDHSLLIKPHVERLKLVYAKTDHWVNSNNRQELLSFYPNLHVEEQPTLHAFVMNPKTVIDYADKVDKFIVEFFGTYK